eukprot:gene7502-10221_t
MSSFDLTQVARKNILELTPYRCARDDYSEGILLDANENSIGAAVNSHGHLKLNRYPDPLHLGLKNEICIFRNNRINKEQIFLGVGSDEAIDILFRIFCNPREDNVLITPPTYGMYKVCAKVNDVEVKTSPLTPSFDVDTEQTISLIDEKTKLLFLCSPGNPTAKVIPNEVVEQLLNHMKNGIVVVDEAYIDFSNTPSAVELVNRYPNLVVLQTLSKAFGLAGIRLGMAIANESIIQLMNNIKAPYNINKLTAEVASTALNNLDLYNKNVELILEERKFLLQGLSSFSIVKKIHHTDANFILFVIPKAQQIYKAMADNGIVCRFRGTELHCLDCLRVTVGTREENIAFLSLLISTAKELGVE